MSEKTQAWDALPVASAPHTTISMIIQKMIQFTNDEQPEYEKWPLIDYDRLEPKSAQELLVEAASEKDLKKYVERWMLFRHAVKNAKMSKRKVRKLISTLDDEKQWAALHYAADCNNEDLCDMLTSKQYEYRCDVNILGGNGENVLHVISQSDCIWSNQLRTGKEPSLLNLLIKELGADVNHANDEGSTPLHLAAMRGQRFYIEYLIKHGAKVDALSKLNASILHFAFLPVNPMNAEELDSLVKYIKEQPAAQTTQFLNLCTLDNMTPLVFLAFHPAITRPSSINKKEEQQIAKNSLMKIFTENIEDKKQILFVFDMIARRQQCQQFDHLKDLLKESLLPHPQEILHLACRYDNDNLLKWLTIEQRLKGYSFTTNSAGYTPLLTATFYNAEKCVQELITGIDDKSQLPLLAIGAMEKDNILHICAKRQVSETLFNRIMEKLSDDSREKLLQDTDGDGNLPLHLAARTNTKEEIMENLSADSKTELSQTKDSDGNLTLLLAIRKNTEKGPYICERFIEEIKRIKCSDNGKSNDGKTSQLLNLLSIKNRRGKTAAHEASEQGHIHILELMWEATRSDDRTKGLFMPDDNNRFTCLHLAAMNKNEKELEVVRYLVETVHIEVDVIGDRRRTPLHLAGEYGHLEIVKYLIEKGASTTFRNAQLLNCLEICIQKQHEEIVKYLLQRPNWREMMRNAQSIEATEAYDTPMRKLIRYMPDVALWMIDEKLTRRVGGAGQKVSKEIYDYEFYEDMYVVKDWYAQGAKLPPEDTSCKARCYRLGVNAIFGCYMRGTYCNSTVKDENRNKEENDYVSESYSLDAYTVVRNHPLFIVSEQEKCPKLMAHQFHILLREKMFQRFSTYWLALSFLFYLILLGLWTALILSGKHPQYFYNLAGFNMTLDIDTCKQVATSLVSKNINDVFKTNAYQQLKVALYVFFWVFIVKNGILIFALFPKVFRIGAYYLEAAVLVLSFVYTLDWYDWQSSVLFRCPVQYQIGAMGLVLAWMNLLTYVRCIPWLGVGIYVSMLQVISLKFLRFLPVLMIIICGFGFTFWMLLQNQDVFGTPIEALLRTSLMMFDLGYEDRIYSAPNAVAYYKLVYVIMILAAIVFCIFIINLLIGLAVGEIPTLLDEGTLWRNKMLYNFVSDGEILRLQFRRFLKFVSRHRLNRISWMRTQPVDLLTYDERAHNWCARAWHYTSQHFFEEKIQDDIELKISSKEDD